MKKQSIDSEKNKTFLKKLKGVICKGAIIIFIAVFTLLLIAGVPLLINGLFEKPAKCDIFAVNWNVEDALSYYAAVLGFVGTVSLGAVAVFQTDRANKETEKANKLALQMQLLEQANFVSMLSVCKLQLDKRSVKHPDYINKDMPQREKIDLTADGFESDYCYHLDVMFKNDSDYPVVQVISHAGTRGNSALILWGMTDKDSAIYIPPHGQQAIRFIIPSRMFDLNNSHALSLSLDFINIFDYATRATIHIQDLDKQNGRCEWAYRLAKFTDVRPR